MNNNQFQGVPFDNMALTNFPEILDCHLSCFPDRNPCGDGLGNMNDTYLFRRKNLMGETKFQSMAMDIVANIKELGEKERPPRSGMETIIMPEYSKHKFGTSICWTKDMEYYGKNKQCDIITKALSKLDKKIVDDMSRYFWSMLNNGDKVDPVTLAPLSPTVFNKPVFGTHTYGTATFSNIFDSSVVNASLGFDTAGVLGDNVLEYAAIEAAMRQLTSNSYDWAGNKTACGCTTAKLYVACGTVVRNYSVLAGVGVIAPSCTNVSCMGYDIQVVYSAYVEQGRGYLVMDEHDVFVAETKALTKCFIDSCVVGGQENTLEIYWDYMSGIETPNGLLLIKF